MRSSILHRAFILIASLACASPIAFAQASAPPEKKPAVETPESRLLSAKKILVIHASGNTIPYDVIKSTLEGWIRFTTVNSPDKADLLVEVSTTGNDDIRVSSSDGPSMMTGRPERSSSTSKEVSNSEVTMTVYDAKTKRVLWTASRTAKYAMKQTTRENNLVDAAEKLASKFHDRLEPPARPKEQD